MEIKIQLPGPEELTKRIVENAAGDILDGYRDEENGRYDGIRIRLEKEITDRVGDSVQARIDSEVDRIITDHLNATIQPTNVHGEPVGDPLTLRGRISAQVDRWLAEKVDREGRPKTSSNSYGSEFHTRAEWAIAKAVDEVARKELAEATAKAQAEVKAQVMGKVTQTTADTLKRLLSLP